MSATDHPGAQEAGMFLRRYTLNKDGKTHTYYALVDSVRTEAGPRQHVVAYLGEVNHDEHRRWQRTVVIYNRQGDSQQLRLFPDDDQVPVPDDPDVVRVRLGSIGWTNGRRFDDRQILSPRSISIYSSNHVGTMFRQQLGRGEGLGFGLTVEVALDANEAGTFRSSGSFGWDGAFGTHFWVDPEEQFVAVLMIQTSVGRLVQRDFETAVMQAILD
jgi:hypothetical protein